MSEAEFPDAAAFYNAGDALLTAARRRDTLIRCANVSVSGSQLAEITFALQASLSERGLEKGERVLIAVRDTPAFFAAFLGAMRGGFVPIPISTLLPPKDVAFIARDAGVRAAVIDRALGAFDDESLYPVGTVRIAAELAGFAGVTL